MMLIRKDLLKSHWFLIGVVLDLNFSTKIFFFFYSFFYLLFCFFLPFDFSTNDCSNSSTRPFIFFNFTSLLEGFGPQPT